MPNTNKQTPAATTDLLEIYRSGTARKLDDLCREQAIIDHDNDCPLDAEDAAEINRASFRNLGDRTYFRIQYRRHVRNLAVGNPFCI
jgi:hypothetical protein